MKKYLVLFRGINVGGNNILPMKELANLLEGLGFADVKTYIQSGNVIFLAPEENKTQLAGKIQGSVNSEFGFEPLVMIISKEELAEAAFNNPFQEASGKMLHFYFMDSPPPAPNFDKMDELKKETEEYKLIGKVFYLYAPEGIGRSKLAEKTEKLLGLPATARNLNTINKLLEMV